VLASLRMIVLAAGEIAFRRGDPYDGLYCVISGAVSFSAVAPSGRGSMVGLAGAPERFGEIALFDGGARTHDARADTPSTLLHLPLRHLTRILDDDPARWRELGRLLVEKLRIALSLLEDMALGHRRSGWRDASSICSRGMANERPRRHALCVSRKSAWE
jgi:CRP/FNR family cyclic AMP-dependent transcriptional regulator